MLEWIGPVPPYGAQSCRPDDHHDLHCRQTTSPLWLSCYQPPRVMPGVRCMAVRKCCPSPAHEHQLLNLRLFLCSSHGVAALPLRQGAPREKVGALSSESGAMLAAQCLLFSDGGSPNTAKDFVIIIYSCSAASSSTFLKSGGVDRRTCHSHHCSSSYSCR